MPRVSGLRSPYATVGRLVLFGRVLDKLRLHAAGKLPPEYATNLGDGNPSFADGRCCRFLGVRYTELREQALATSNDDAVLEWAETAGIRRTDEECDVWNGFVTKLGWRDRASARLQQRAAECGLVGKPFATLFDLMDYDEGRDPVACQAWEPERAAVIVLMGVAGSGKTTIGRALAAALRRSFRDADEFHSASNIAKMSAGIPLTDEDRQPWLAAIRAHIDACLARREKAVVTCSALRESYRQALSADPLRVKWVHLAGDPALIQQRLAQRTGHFMTSALLASQFATLELPTNALTIDVALPPDAIVAEIRDAYCL